MAGEADTPAQEDETGGVEPAAAAEEERTGSWSSLEAGTSGAPPPGAEVLGKEQQTSQILQGQRQPGRGGQDHGLHLKL